jgi:hypothetical protein
MGIEILDSVVQPAITYNRIHLVRLLVEQPLRTNENSTPKYHVMVVYKMYGVDESNKIYYKPEEHEIEVEDFLTLAMTEHESGDPTMVLAFKSIETALATLINKDQGLNTKVI